MNSSRILVSGASGPIGAALLPSLKAAGIRRHAPGSRTQLPAKIKSHGTRPSPCRRIWFPASTRSFIWPENPSSAAGPRPRSGASSKAAVQGTGHLAEAAAKASQRPRVFISASAVGFYGNRGDEILREDSPSGEGFAAEICRQWEAATQPAAQAGIRTAQMRIGVVMSADGGALPKMLTPFRMGLGGRLGNGRQWWTLGLGATMSWARFSTC